LSVRWPVATRFASTGSRRTNPSLRPPPHPASGAPARRQAERSRRSRRSRTAMHATTRPLPDHSVVLLVPADLLSGRDSRIRVR
jgi:hypothetical protein